MKRRNLIIGGSIFFLVFLVIVYNIPEERTKEEQQKSISVEQVNQDSLRIARVNSATAKAESLARVRNKVIPYSKTIPINQTSVTSPVRSEEEIVTERYAGLIDEYGRDRAGIMIQAEIKDAWEDDRTRASMLMNASAAAMQGDYELSKVQQENREKDIQKKVDAQFSPWSGEHRLLVDTVKKTLNDPGSFEHLETTTMKGTGWPDSFIVKMDYSAKNAYGGRVRASVTVLMSSEGGHILQVLDEG